MEKKSKKSEDIVKKSNKSGKARKSEDETGGKAARVRRMKKGSTMTDKRQDTKQRLYDVRSVK